MESSNNSRLLTWLSPLVYLSSNAVSLIGVVLATAGGVSWFFLLPGLWRTPSDNPYFGLLWAAILTVFVAGLVLIPAGIQLRRIRLRRQGLPGQSAFPPLTLGSPELRRLLVFIGITTFANVIIAGQLTYSAVNYMETKSFCGATCHSVMSPEYTAYQTGPHSHVDCVRCHAGPGVTGFVQSKLRGVHQLTALTFNTYARPIPPPVNSMLPASETCLECHSLKGQAADVVRVTTKFNDDEKNTPTRTVLLVHLEAIHKAHMGANTIRFAADEKREKIAWVERTSGGGSTIFTAAGTKADPPEGLRTPPEGLRTMDCLDCHNRPAHTFELPERALDRALATGTMPSLPFVKKWGLGLLKKTYAAEDEAAAQIPAALAAHYPAQPKAEVDKAAAALVSIYQNNVFPRMKIGWGTYPSQLGHTDATGCFRCHDDAHTSASGGPPGKTIGQDCALCHNLVAVDDPSPKVLTDLGMGDK